MGFHFKIAKVASLPALWSNGENPGMPPQKLWILLKVHGSILAKRATLDDEGKSMTLCDDIDDGGVAVAEPEVRTRQRTRKQPNYALIIENDDDHTFDYVVLVVSRVCGHSIEKALELVLHAHNNGEAMVWSGTLELAELKQSQIREFGPDPFATKPVDYPLGVRIEPLVGDE